MKTQCFAILLAIVPAQKQQSRPWASGSVSLTVAFCTSVRHRRPVSVVRCLGSKSRIPGTTCAAAVSSSDLGGSDDTQLVPYTDPRLVARAVLPSVALVTPVGVRNATSRGSGFVVDFPTPPTHGIDRGATVGDDEGTVLHLLTAAHVAQPGHRLEVSFSSGAEAEASVMGRDTRADLALLRLTFPASGGDRENNPPPPPLKISEEEEQEVGTPAFAVGYPSGGIRGAAMTSGIVSASAYGLGYFDVSPDDDKNLSDSKADDKNRKVKDEKESIMSLPAFARTSFVVTDAAMAGGMSGGPLVDGSSGMVLGVNALVRPDLRALGNYAVDAGECRAFLAEMARRLLSLEREGGKNETSANVEGRIGYKVILYNDRFNKRARVAEILASVGLNATEAEETMIMAHTRGKSVVRIFPGLNDGSREAALEMCKSLREQDVLVEVEPL